jgi:hypothetical protein
MTQEANFISSLLCGLKISLGRNGCERYYTSRWMIAEIARLVGVHILLNVRKGMHERAGSLADGD